MINDFSSVSSLIYEYLSFFGKTMGFSFILNIAFYFFGAYAIYAISKNINIKAPYISFIPFVQSFAIGRIAEKYIKKDGSKSAKFSIILLIFNILQSILLVLFIFFTFVSIFSIIANVENAIANDIKVNIQMFSSFIPVIILFFVLFAVSLCYKIFYAISLWRIFAIFDKSNATLYTVISVLCTVISPIFLFVIRNNTPAFDFKSRAGHFYIEQV